MFRMGKIAKSSFLDEGYYKNEGFSLDMNMTCSTQTSRFSIRVIDGVKMVLWRCLSAKSSF